MARKLKAVSIWGIKFDALLNFSQRMNSTVPQYVVEKGYPISDGIINQPITLDMTLFLTNTPVTYNRRKASNKRIKKITNKIKKAWEKKKLAKIVTNDGIYKNMAITTINITEESRGSRKIQITAQKVYKTAKKTAKIPDNVMHAGATASSAGSANTSNAPANYSAGADPTETTQPTSLANSIMEEATNAWNDLTSGFGISNPNSSLPPNAYIPTSVQEARDEQNTSWAMNLFGGLF